MKFESRMWVWGRVAFLYSILADSPNGSYLNFRKSLYPNPRHSQWNCLQQQAKHWSTPSPALLLRILRQLLSEPRPLVMMVSDFFQEGRYCVPTPSLWAQTSRMAEL